MKYVIDVSKYQGNIDWPAVAEALKKANNGEQGGAILRVGYSHYEGGLTVDEKFQRNMEGCEAAGIPFGAYVYAYDKSTKAAAASAQFVADKLKGHKLGYPVYYDIEYEPFYLGSTKKVNTDIVVSAVETFEANNLYAGVYASRDFFLSHLDLKRLLPYTLWEAAYVSSDSTHIANDMWQYSSSNPLRIPGFGTALDTNVTYKDFPAIMQATGLNGYGVSNHHSSIWDDYITFQITATGEDRKPLKEVCEKYQLIVKAVE